MSSSRQPLIGVTGSDRLLPTAWWCIHWALKLAGARTCRLTVSRPEPPAPLDALIVSGGDDIDVSLYLPDATDVSAVDPQRDAFEIRMLETALARDWPVLGICRGAQLLNVVLGGSLHPDLRPLRRRTSNRRTPLPRKLLQLEPQSRLQGIMRVEQTRINSLHHQAIDTLGQGLTISGRDLDGIIQAVEKPGHRFLIGVQWHPEYLLYSRQQRQLFQALVAAIN